MYYSFPYASQPLTHRLRRRSFRLGPATNISNRIAQYCGRVFHFANFAWNRPLSNGGLCQKGKEGKGREGKGKDRKGKERTGKDRKRKDRKRKDRKGHMHGSSLYLTVVCAIFVVWAVWELVFSAKICCLGGIRRELSTKTIKATTLHNPDLTLYQARVRLFGYVPIFYLSNHSFSTPPYLQKLSLSTNKFITSIPP